MWRPFIRSQWIKTELVPCGWHQYFLSSLNATDTVSWVAWRAAGVWETCRLKIENQVHRLAYPRLSVNNNNRFMATIKLFSIKPVLGKNKPRTSLCRRDETVITRLRIGHSRVPHSYLLSRESQPVCDHCKCYLMVKDMLLECPSTAVIF